MNNTLIRNFLRIFAFVILVVLYSVAQHELGAPMLFIAILCLLLYFVWKKTENIKDVPKQSDIGKNGYTELMLASEVGDVELLKKLLWEKVDVDQVNERGETALMYAARMGNKTCVLALLESGANVLVKSKKGDTASKFAKSQRHEVLFKILREYEEYQTTAR